MYSLTYTAISTASTSGCLLAELCLQGCQRTFLFAEVHQVPPATEPKAVYRRTSSTALPTPQGFEINKKKHRAATEMSAHGTLGHPFKRKTKKKKRKQKANNNNRNSHGCQQAEKFYNSSTCQKKGQRSGWIQMAYWASMVKACQFL